MELEKFSKLEYAFENFQHELEREKLSAPLISFSQAERTKEAQAKRLEKVYRDFWFFDKTYFNENFYEDYAEPNKMLKKIVSSSTTPGYHLFIGPRKHGKSVTAKKLLLWLTLTGKVQIAGVYSETINKSAAILKDIYKLCITNDRLMFDFDVEFSEANSDSLAFIVHNSKEIDDQFLFDKRISRQDAKNAKNGRQVDERISRQVAKNAKNGMRFIASFSEGRSLRGYTRMFGRPSLLIADDVETLESSFSPQAVRLRIEKLFESYHSLGDNGVFIILANDFNTSSAVHQIRLQHEENLLAKNWNVYIYKAFDKQPLWKERFKVKTESELKKLLKPSSEADWQANYQQNPIEPEGFFFLRENFITYKTLPKDVKAVLYCDPNLSKKGKGNTTAITVLGYSPKEDKYYLIDAVCKSFSDSNDLLDTIFMLRQAQHDKIQVYAIAFDGNVTQESTWSQFVRNWCTINKIPFPVIEYKRYRVNDIAKNVQLIYSQNKLLFPDNFSKTENGERYLNQLFAFTGEKGSSLDDAPDSLICAFEFLHERKLVRSNDRSFVKVMNDFYQL